MIVHLERVAAVVLLLVLAALACMTGAAYLPEWAVWISTEVAVVFLVALLTLALTLVSTVALVQLNQQNAGSP